MKNITRFLLCTGILVSIFSCDTPKEEDQSKPNVILILVDDFGYGDISYEGNTQIKTPNIDRIAENGAHFTRFYQSGAACAPTRASLLTGRYHLSTGVWGVHQGRDFILRDETLIGEVMQDAGYVTGAFGKWHSGKIWPYFSWNRGFDVGVHSRLYQYFDTRVIYNNKIINVEGPITDVLGDQVVRFIEDNKEQPFFAYVPFQSIHEPYNCPTHVFYKYKDLGYTDHVARLYGMIEVMDDNIGKIVNTVEENELLENTIIMFLVDDGPSPGFDLSYSNRRMNDEEKEERRRAWPKVLRGGKGSIWEGGMISPFYIQWQGKIEPGIGYPHLTGVIDLFPTILDICNIPVPDENLPIHGRSIWPIIKGEVPEDWDERRYFDNTNFYLKPRELINIDKPQMHHIALQYKNYKMIRCNDALYGGPDSVYYLLYDLVADPLEENNILDTEPDLADQLIDEVESWYSGILEKGRAFGQAVYEIGNWEETSTPINLDAVKELKGSVERVENSMGRFTNWTEPGAAITFEIDVVEKGSYLVEIGYSCESSELGSTFKVYTEADTARLQIDDPESAISDTLILPAGRQILHIELDTIGKGNSAVDVMSQLMIHRIPESVDPEILRNVGMEFSGSEGNTRKFNFTSATADFMFGRDQGDPFSLNKGEILKIVPFADNMDQVDSVNLYLDFEKVSTLHESPYAFSIEASEIGRQTINVELVSRKGIIRAVHGDILVEE